VRPEQTVSEMRGEVLDRQASTLRDRAGEPFESSPEYGPINGASLARLRYLRWLCYLRYIVSLRDQGRGSPIE
jgi:hypothetical protein